MNLEKVIRQIVRDEIAEIKKESAPPVSVKEKQESLLTSKEACEFLRCSKPTLSRWKNAGIVPHVRIGRNIRYRKSDIEKILKSK